MKREVISEAISNINEKYIEEADEFQVAKKAKKRAWRKWLPVAACLCLVVAGVTTYFLFKTAHPWRVRFEKVSWDEADMQPSIAEIPRWETQPIYLQYNTVEWNGETYSARSAEIPADRIGDFLGDVTANGWDDYAKLRGEDGKRQIDAKIYAVTKISTECIIAVQYEGEEGWYAFENSRYRPETLGQFVEDLNLREEVVFNTIHYSSYTPTFGDYANVHFENVDICIIWEWLFSEPEAENVYDQLQLHQIPKEILGISTDIPLWGSKNISVSVHEGGYIMTNILSTGKLFYIGEEKTQGFVDYVLNECEGYETIYFYEDSGEPEFGENGDSEDIAGGASEGMSESVYEGAASPSVAPKSGETPK